MRVERIAASYELPELKEHWDRLAGYSPFCSWQWLGNWWRYYGDDSQLYILAAWQGEELRGLAPLLLRQRPGRGRCLELLGTGEVCSDYLGLLIQEEGREETIAALADWLADPPSADDRWDLLYLEGSPEPEPGLAALADALVGRGSKLHRKPHVNCWRIVLPATWDEYLAMQSKSHRKQLRRLERRVLEDGHTHLHTVTSPDEFSTAWDILVDLHQRRRQSLDQPGCFASEPFSQFLREASLDLLREGSCRLHWLEHCGAPIAAELHFTQAGVAYAYQAGVEPTALDLEPGRLITMAIVRYSIKEGLAALDFLRGDEPYKAHFRAEPRPMFAWRVAAPRLAAHVRQGMLVAGGNLKELMKDSLNRVGLR